MQSEPGFPPLTNSGAPRATLSPVPSGYTCDEATGSLPAEAPRGRALPFSCPLISPEPLGWGCPQSHPSYRLTLGPGHPSTPLKASLPGEPAQSPCAMTTSLKVYMMPLTQLPGSLSHQLTLCCHLDPRKRNAHVDRLTFCCTDARLPQRALAFASRRSHKLPWRLLDWGAVSIWWVSVKARQVAHRWWGGDWRGAQVVGVVTGRGGTPGSSEERPAPLSVLRSCSHHGFVSLSCVPASSPHGQPLGTGDFAGFAHWHVPGHHTGHLDGAR